MARIFQTYTYNYDICLYDLIHVFHCTKVSLMKWYKVHLVKHPNCSWHEFVIWVCANKRFSKFDADFATKRDREVDAQLLRDKLDNRVAERRKFLGL